VEILFDRDVRSMNSTLSKVYVDAVFECFALEDVDRGLKSEMPLDEIAFRKLRGATCIPEGKYKCIVTFSNRFQRDLPLLVNVPGFEGIRIHPGNTAENTDGCLLPGEARTKDFVSNSVMTFNRLFEKIKTALAADQQIWVIIKP
jgi:hypothetical protein